MEERLWHRAERNSWIRMAHIAAAFFSLIASLERKKGALIQSFRTGLCVPGVGWTSLSRWLSTLYGCQFLYLKLLCACSRPGVR